MRVGRLWIGERGREMLQQSLAVGRERNDEEGRERKREIERGRERSFQIRVW